MAQVVARHLVASAAVPFDTGQHFTEAEMDNVQKWKAQSWTPTQMHDRLVKDRRRNRTLAQVWLEDVAEDVLPPEFGWKTLWKTSWKM